MTTAIETLKQAVAKVRQETGENFVFASIEFGGWSPQTDAVKFRVYRSESHTFDTLEQSVSAAIAFDAKAQKLAEAAQLRKKADELEKEAV